MKKVKSPRFAHTSDSKIGMGDFYGSGIRQKIGRVRDSFTEAPTLNKKKLKTPPKSLA